MKYTIFTVTCFCAVFFTACGTKNATQQPKSTEVVLEEVKIFKHTGNCENEKEPCALVDMRILQTGDTSLQCMADINRILRLSAMQCAMILPDSLSGEPDANTTAAEFITGYENFMREFPDAMGNWEARSSMKLLFQNDSLFCVLTQGYNYSGGAHPNSLTDIILYDKQNCRRIKANELFVQSTDLNKIVEKHFRINRQIPVNQSLNEFGFFFEKDSFLLPANIGLEKDSVLFIFNDYEVGPHVMGPSEFRVPKSELLPYLKTKY